MSDANTMLHVYVRTARTVLSRALAKLDTTGLDEDTVNDIISAVCVANQLPELMRDILNAEQEEAA